MDWRMMSTGQTAQAAKIEFQCTCGAHFRVDARLSGRMGRCQTCGAALTIPQASTSEPVAAAKELAEAQDGAGQGTEGQEVPVQALCSICQCPVDDGEDVLTCPECHLPFHSECWQENLGCSTYGCPQVNILKKGPDLKIDGVPGGNHDGQHNQQIWHCAVGNQFYGPASALELAAWAREKRITAANMAWKAGMAKWLPISSLPELVSVVDPGHSTQSSDASFPWELVLLAASAIGFLLSLVAYGIPSLLVLIGSGVSGAHKIRNANRSKRHRKYAAILVLAFVVSLAGFLTGLIMGMESS
jgi:hypothetical protein